MKHGVVIHFVMVYHWVLRVESQKRRGKGLLPLFSTRAPQAHSSTLGLKKLPENKAMKKKKVNYVFSVPKFLPSQLANFNLFISLSLCTAFFLS